MIVSLCGNSLTFSSGCLCGFLIPRSFCSRHIHFWYNWKSYWTHRPLVLFISVSVKYSFQTTSPNISLEFVRHLYNQAFPDLSQKLGLEPSRPYFNKLSWWFSCKLKFENQCTVLSEGRGGELPSWCPLCVPLSASDALHTWHHLILTMISLGISDHSFTGEETEAQMITDLSKVLELLSGTARIWTHV